MAGHVLYSSDNLDIHHEQSEGWLYANWKGYQSVDMVKAGCEEMLRLLAALRLSKVLNDNTLVTGIWVGAAAWVAGNWFPRMQQAGLRHFAWVQSPARLSFVSATTTLQQALPGTAVLFDNLETATTWLRAQP
ncbi:hypothetical protein [Pyxidicoccus xibeiensis]|uniref:hypothetical protein n=1 Tax=Pyxidicoccus xibeiensis TaxID=2906759 RepID=UPI0020A775D0|nr:hypothetical protein [Pyxidicoccus xibeiensis]MCP3137383.1 hypothetical protein [Pyxidicoccus xibeiensis]